MAKKKVSCYLCNRTISKQARTKDHVPPRLIFTSDFKGEKGPGLLTLLAHDNCNGAYAKDEAYFLHSVGTLSEGSTASNSVWKDLAHTFKDPLNQSLGIKILGEFSSKTPGGIQGPNNVRFKTFEDKRVRRILWKITRGLYFHHYKKFLPEGLNHYVASYFPRSGRPDPAYDPILATPERGRYKEYFDYKFVDGPLKDNHLYGWGFRFWSVIYYFLIFEIENCSCEKCLQPRK